MPSVTEESNRTEPFPSYPVSDMPSNGERPNTMPPVLEEAGATSNDQTYPDVQPIPRKRRLTPNSKSLLSLSSWGRGSARHRDSAASETSQPDMDADLINLLDVIDPEVSTLSTLTNVQNSLFIPDLSFLNRRPTYTLTTNQSQMASRRNTVSEEDTLQNEVDEFATAEALERRKTSESFNSELSETRYAVLPHGVSIDDWTEAEKAELNDHVRHLLHSRRAAFKRGMKGFGQYVKRPMGLFVTIYASLVTIFGLVWVLFLIGWISVGAKRYYVINIIDNILVALFAIMGDGLAPFRAVDTYHMIYIAHYHHFTWSKREKKKLPELPNHNDLPAVRTDDPDHDLEAGGETDDNKGNFYSVLSPKQQQKLEHHQNKFSKSHTFYKPHETETHFAFPLRLLIAIVVLLDCHSIFQIALGTFTWSHETYADRPFAVTTAILCCSLACNITGGILISIGDHKTRKKDVKERMFRQQLTEDALKRIEKRKQREAERDRELELEVLPEEAKERVYAET